MFFRIKRKNKEKIESKCIFCVLLVLFIFLKRKTVFKNYKQTILNLGIDIMKFNLKIILNSDDICDAPFPEDPVDHRRPAKNCMSHIMRPIRE